MKLSDARRADDQHVVQRVQNNADKVEQFATPPSPHEKVLAQRRLEYSERIVNALPLTTEALMVAISEVASTIDDPTPPSVLTVCRWLYLHQRTVSGIGKTRDPKNRCHQDTNVFLYEE